MAKVGRPTDDPKEFKTSFRLSAEDMEKLQFCMNKGYTKAEIIRVGISLAYNQLCEKGALLDPFLTCKNVNK